MSGAFFLQIFDKKNIKSIFDILFLRENQAVLFYYLFVNSRQIKIVLKNVLLFVFQIAFSRLQFGAYFSFGFAFALSRVFWNENLLVVSAEYLVSTIIFNFGKFYELSAIAFEIVILTLFFYFKEISKLQRKILFLHLFLALSCMLKLYFAISHVLIWKDFLIETAMKFLALDYFLLVHKLYLKKFVFFKCSNVDFLMFLSFLVLTILGIFRYDIFFGKCEIFVFSLLLIFCCRVLTTDKFFLLSLALALTFSQILGSSKFLYLSVITILALTAISKFSKYFYLAVATCLAFVILNLSGTISIARMSEILVAVVIMICLPQKLVNQISRFFEDKRFDIISENQWLIGERELKQKLNLLAKTFQGMRDDFRFLLVGKIDRKSAANELAKDIIKKSCDSCENYKLCRNSLIDKQNIVSEFLFYAMQKGQIFADEISVGFKTYCHRTNIFVSEINKFARQYVEFEASVKNEDESKLLIASEFENISMIFDNLSKNISAFPKHNKKLSLLAREVLTNYMIEVGDVGVFENAFGVEKIDVVVNNEVAIRKELGDALSKIAKTKVQIQNIRHLEISGLSLVSYVIANDLTAEFAFSSKSKEEVSGDNAVISKVDDNRFFVAIADGMGHGKFADKTSKMVLELIKNLFVVGVDLNLIIDSINKLLLPAGLDNFSTLDAAIIDLRHGECNFIKLGSSVSLLKHKQTTEMISCQSLPVGIVKNLKPTIITKKVMAGDTIVLASDGVVDSFGEVEKYKIFINDAKIDNLQRFTDNVLFDISLMKNKHKDDMSIIAVKLLKNFVK